MALAEAPAVGSGLVVVGEQELPPRLRRARDVRWASPSSVYLTEIEQGLLEIALGDFGLEAIGSGADQPAQSRQASTSELGRRGGEGAREPDPIRQLIAGHKQPGGMFLPSILAVSSTTALVASPVFSWFVLPKASNLPWSSEERPLAFTVDLDLQGDRVLVLGGHREEERFVPSGFIAWEGLLADAPDNLQPLVLSADGPGAASMADCALMEIGAVRYLADGSFVVVPGVQPGVFLYGPDGRLSRTWKSEDLGFFTGCGLQQEVAYRLAMDPNGRMFWVNARIVLDEILPFPEGPGLILRRWGAEGTSWSMKLLHRDGTVVEMALPVTAKSRFARLRGDVRGNEIVLLKLEHGEQYLDEPPKLFLLERR